MAQVKKLLAALNDSVEIDVPTDQPALPTVQLPVGWAGSLVVEATIVGGNDYVALGMVPAAGGAAVAVMAAAGMWTGPVGAYDKVRARVSVAGAGGIVGLSVSNY